MSVVVTFSLCYWLVFLLSFLYFRFGFCVSVLSFCHVSVLSFVFLFSVLRSCFDFFLFCFGFCDSVLSFFYFALGFVILF